MNHIQHVCTLYGQSVEFLFVNAGVMSHILLFATSSWCCLPYQKLNSSHRPIMSHQQK